MCFASAVFWGALVSKGMALVSSLYKNPCIPFFPLFPFCPYLWAGSKWKGVSVVFATGVVSCGVVPYASKKGELIPIFMF